MNIAILDSDSRLRLATDLMLRAHFDACVSFINPQTQRASQIDFDQFELILCHDQAGLGVELFEYLENKNIPVPIILYSEEMRADLVSLKQRGLFGHVNCRDNFVFNLSDCLKNYGEQYKHATTSEKFIEIHPQLLPLILNSFTQDLYQRAGDRFIPAQGITVKGNYCHPKDIDHLLLALESYLDHLDFGDDFNNPYDVAENINLILSEFSGIDFLDDKTYEKLQSSMKNCLKQIEKNREAKSLLFKSMINRNFWTKQSVLCSLLSIKLLPKLLSGNTLEEGIDKFIMAALLQDLALFKVDNYSQFSTKEFINEENMENRLFNSHPSVSAQLIARMDFGYHDLEQIVASSHELPLGTGFPRKVRWQSLTMTSSLFAFIRKVSSIIILAQGVNSAFSEEYEKLIEANKDCPHFVKYNNFLSEVLPYFI